MKTSVDVDVFLQWIGLVENISIVIQSGTRQVSFTNLTHLSSMRIFFFRLSLFFSFFFWRGLPNKNRNAAVLTAEHSEDILVCDKNALSMNNRLAINRAKFSSRCVCVVYILYVYVQHMQARHNSHVSVYYQLYVFHTWGYFEIIWLFQASSPSYTIIFGYKNSITI